MGKLLWFFDITAPGPVDTEIETAFSTGFLTAPKPISVVFKPRSEERAEILRREFQIADEFLSKYDQKPQSWRCLPGEATLTLV
jgi:hypothetical protein